MAHFSVVPSRPPSCFASRLAAVAPPPGPFPPLCVCPAAAQSALATDIRCSALQPIADTMQWDVFCYCIPAVHLPINLSPSRCPHIDVERPIFLGDMMHTSAVFDDFILWGLRFCCHTS